MVTNREVVEQMVSNAKNMEPVWQTDRSYQTAVYYRAGLWYIGIPRVSTNDPRFNDYQKTVEALLKKWDEEDSAR